MTKLEIFGFAGSTYVRTALMVCEEKAVDYALRPLDFGAPSHRALHPFLKMPAMRHGETSLFEAVAIASYVDAIGPGPALQPDRAENRALMWQWVSSAIDYLYDPLVRAGLGGDAEAEDARRARSDALDVVESLMADRMFLAGDGLSFADLFLVPMVAFAVTRQSGGAGVMLATRPRLAAWYDALTARDSFKRTAG